jgi:tubby-related protein 1
MYGRTMRLPTTKNRVEMGAVKYHVNVLGIAGPRKMTAIIPSLQEDGKPHVFPPAADGGPVLMDDYKCGQYRDKMVIMHNKQPHFNKQVIILEQEAFSEVETAE